AACASSSLEKECADDRTEPQHERYCLRAGADKRSPRAADPLDEPRRSVEDADRLVADLMQNLAARFADERERLESQWDRGDDVSTEDLGLALTRYRSFFDRLLSA